VNQTRQSDEDVIEAYRDAYRHALATIRTLKSIVTDLAETREPEDREMSYCLLCDVDRVHQDHDPSCPWRRAREWVKEAHQ